MTETSKLTQKELIELRKIHSIKRVSYNGEHYFIVEGAPMLFDTRRGAEMWIEDWEPQFKENLTPFKQYDEPIDQSSNPATINMTAIDKIMDEDVT